MRKPGTEMSGEGMVCRAERTERVRQRQEHAWSRSPETAAGRPVDLSQQEEEL